MTYPIKSPRKLIEVALPLDAISEEASLRKRKAPAGYPTALHKWWAQRPPAAARAVIFAQHVNDPGYQQGGGFRYGKNKTEAAIERKRLFEIIKELVLWENTNSKDVLERARAELLRSWREVCDLNRDHPSAATLFNPESPPSLFDPFAGGGTIPLEAQRLGLAAEASDLNPVAVLINKAMIEIPPRFIGRAPIGPELDRRNSVAKLALGGAWPGTRGLAEDVRRYGNWVCREARARLGHLYPSVEITEDLFQDRPELRPLKGKQLPVVAWLWARTVKSPNPAFSHVDVPLVSTYVLAKKKADKSGGAKTAYVHPEVTGDQYKFNVRMGTPPDDAESGTQAGAANGSFRCILSNAPISPDYIKVEGQAGRIGSRLLAVIIEGPKGRVYLSPTKEMEVAALKATPEWSPSGLVPARLSGGTCVPYGLREWGNLFTRRQLVALKTFSDLLTEVSARIQSDAIAAGLSDDGMSLEEGGAGAQAYAEAIRVYLALAQSRAEDYGCSLSTWRPKDSAMRSALAKQALPMTWDFAEANPLGQSSAGFRECVEVVARVVETCLGPMGAIVGKANQADAGTPSVTRASRPVVISTDPPYYDNIFYADLSDFFYVWLRENLKDIFPSLFATISVPKAEELVATAFRHGGKAAAAQFFLEGMTRALSNLALQSHPAFPVTIYYAFKQTQTKADGTSSTGWETFLSAVIAAGFSITGTWPVRTEGDNRQVGVGNNALASSIVLVCRRRPDDAPTILRREFLRELNAVLPDALDEMTKGAEGERSPVDPVDLSQAIIGPGMGVFSKYAAVLEADGSAMTVHTALKLINRFLAEDDFDSDTQFCLHWFEQHGWGDGRFGDAELLSRAKGTSVDGVRVAGVIKSGGGVVRLLKWSEYPSDWDPKTDTRNPVWETLHHLIRALKQDGESGAGALLAAVKGKAEAVRQLAYRLYTLCERKGWAEDARAYNELITSWTGIEVAAGSVPAETQADLFA